jgi:hypothetical protein
VEGRDVKRKADRDLPHGEVAGTDVSVKLILARAVLMERAEEAAVGFTERACLDAARRDGGVNVGVVGGIADGEDELTRVKRDVFVAGDAVDFKLPCGHADEQSRVLGDCDGHLKLVPRAPGHAQLRVTRGALETDREIPGIVGVLASDVNGDLIVIRSDDAEIAGAQFYLKPAAGREVDRERMILEIADFEFRLRQACGYEQRKAGKDSKNRAHTHLLASATRNAARRGNVSEIEKAVISGKREAVCTSNLIVPDAAVVFR